MNNPDDFLQTPQAVASGELNPATDGRTRYLLTVGESPAGQDNEYYPAGYLDVETPLIPNGRLHRCVLTPVRSLAVPAAPGTVPDGMILTDSENVTTYQRYAGTEVENLLQLHGKNDGLVEVVELRGLETHTLAQLKPTAYFFPNWPVLPELNASNPRQPELESLEQLVTEKLATLPQTTYDVQAQAYLRAIGNALLKSIKAVDTYHRQTIQVSNVALEVKDGRHKGSYDSLDHLAFRRTGQVRRHEALDNLAGERQVQVVIEQPATPAPAGMGPDQIMAMLQKGIEVAMAEGMRLGAQAMRAELATSSTATAAATPTDDKPKGKSARQ